MSNCVHLYDIRERNYPSFKGSTFRSVQVFRCWVCGTLTNRIVIGGNFSIGIRTVCPYSSRCWHHELEEKKTMLERPHPRAYRVALEKECSTLLADHHYELRDDISGIPDRSLESPVSNTKTFRGEQPCKHYLDDHRH